MNKEIKKLWVEALRSGDYEQTKKRLRKGDAFCCLGVLCNLHAQAHPEIAAEQQRVTSYMGAAQVLPHKVMEWAGLRSTHGDAVRIDNYINPLAHHNDYGRTFKQIADAIESQL